jgi:hypothetical protein
MYKGIHNTLHNEEQEIKIIKGLENWNNSQKMLKKEINHELSEKDHQEVARYK